MDSAIGKDFTVYDKPLVQETDCFIYCGWDKFRTIAGIVQHLDLWTNCIGYTSDTYYMDIKLTFLEFHTVFVPDPSYWNVSSSSVGVPFPAPLFWYYYHLPTTNTTGDSLPFGGALLDLNLTCCSQQIGGVRPHEVFWHLYYSTILSHWFLIIFKTLISTRKTTERSNSLLFHHARSRPKKHREGFKTTFPIQAQHVPNRPLYFRFMVTKRSIGRNQDDTFTKEVSLTVV